MLRVRQASQGASQGAVSRLAAIIAFSAVAHVYLIYGLPIAPVSGTGGRVSIIQARLLSPPAVPPGRLPDIAPPSGRSQPVPSSRPWAEPDIAAPAQTVAQPIAVESVPAVPVAEAIDVEPLESGGDKSAAAALADMFHYSASELDVYPRPIRPIAASYPVVARDAQVAGAVTMLVLIDEVGRVLSTSVLDADPAGVFEASAQQALAGAAFVPARKDGRAVRSRIAIRIEFDPAGGDIRNEPTGSGAGEVSGQAAQ